MFPLREIGSSVYTSCERDVEGYSSLARGSPRSTLVAFVRALCSALPTMLFEWASVVESPASHRWVFHWRAIRAARDERPAARRRERPVQKVMYDGSHDVGEKIARSRSEALWAEKRRTRRNGMHAERPLRAPLRFCGIHTSLQLRHRPRIHRPATTTIDGTIVSSRCGMIFAKRR